MNQHLANTNNITKLKSSYENCGILKKFIRKDRFYVQIDKGNGSTETLPHGNYTWLIGNPAFPGIPRGYVIHHLDNNPLNDDISNLVLMAKNHHRAYHLKYQNIDIPIEFRTDDFDNKSFDGLVPITRPRVYYNKRHDTWRIWFRTREADGQGKDNFIYSYKRKTFKTKEQAEAAISKIWPFEWKEE